MFKLMDKKIIAILCKLFLLNSGPMEYNASLQGTCICIIQSLGEKPIRSNKHPQNEVHAQIHKGGGGTKGLDPA